MTHAFPTRRSSDLGWPSRRQPRRQSLSDAMQLKTTALRALFLGGCLATLPLSLALAQAEMDFTAAKSAADADEASLDAATSAAALEQDRKSTRLNSSH